MILGLEYFYLQSLVFSNIQEDFQTNLTILRNISANRFNYLEDGDSLFSTANSEDGNLLYLPQDALIELHITQDNLVSSHICESHIFQEILSDSIGYKNNIISTYFSTTQDNKFLSGIVVLPSNSLNNNLRKLALALVIVFIVVIIVCMIPALLLIESHRRKLLVIKTLTLTETCSSDRILFEGILKSSSIGGMILAVDGSILLINDYCKKLLEVGDTNTQTLSLSSCTVLPLIIRQMKFDTLFVQSRENITINQMNGSIVECLLEIFPYKKENKLTTILFLFSPVSLLASDLSINEKNDPSLNHNIATMKNQLNRAIMHKINNHLSGIIGLISIELDKSNQSSDQNNLTSVLKSSEKMSELFTELQKSFTNDNKNLIKNPIEELDRIADILKNVLPPSVSVEISGSFLQGIKVARTVFREFFYGLALNSTEIMNGEGRIRVDVSEKMPVFNRSVDSFPVGKKVCIRYSDGYIMPVALRDVFLNRNYSATDVERLFGSTIGNVYKSISDNLGEIVFERGSGETILCLLLDSYQLSHKKASVNKTILMKNRVNGIKVLIADETSMVVDSIAEYLELNGVFVVKANTGVVVEKLLGEGNFDAIVIGLNMARQSTRNLVTFCQTNRSEMKILITTGYDFPLEIEEFVKNPSTSYLHKPYKPSDLLKQLEVLLFNRNAGVEGGINHDKFI